MRSKHIQINPILKKELMVGSRNMKMSWAIFGLNAFLSAIAVVTMYSLELNAEYSGYNYANLVSLFPILGIVECVILSLVIPIITSGSISGERERQTLDIMLTTPVKPFSIALGKLGSALMLVMMYMISSVPVLSIAFILGGLNWASLFGLIVMMLYIGIYVGSIGIFCSSAVKKSVAATVLTMLISWAVTLLTILLFVMLLSIKTMLAVSSGTYSISIVYEPLVLMLNPYAPVVDFFLQSCSSIGVYDILADFLTVRKFPTVLRFIYQHWMVFSTAWNLLVSFGFLKLAAHNIAATHNHKVKKQKNKDRDKSVDESRPM